MMITKFCVQSVAACGAPTLKLLRCMVCMATYSLTVLCVNDASGVSVYRPVYNVKEYWNEHAEIN